VTVFKNLKDNVSTVLNADVGADATAWVLQAGQGADMPPAPFYASCDVEVAVCTAVAGDTLTVIRGQDQTAAAPHLANAAVEIRPVAALWTDAYRAINTLESSRARVFALMGA